MEAENLDNLVPAFEQLASVIAASANKITEALGGTGKNVPITTSSLSSSSSTTNVTHVAERGQPSPQDIFAGPGKNVPVATDLSIPSAPPAASTEAAGGVSGPASSEG